MAKKGGKWAKLRGELPAAQPDDEKFEDKVRVKKDEYKTCKLVDGELVKQEFGKLTLGDAMTAYRFRKDEKEKLEGQIEGLNVELEALNRILLDVFEAQDLQTTSMPDGPTFYIQTEPVVKTDDPEALRKWLVDTNQDALRTLQWQKLLSLVKLALESKDNPMPKGITVEQRTQIKMRR